MFAKEVSKHHHKKQTSITKHRTITSGGCKKPQMATKCGQNNTKMMAKRLHSCHQNGPVVKNGENNGKPPQSNKAFVKMHKNTQNPFKILPGRPTDCTFSYGPGCSVPMDPVGDHALCWEAAQSSGHTLSTTTSETSSLRCALTLAWLWIWRKAQTTGVPWTCSCTALIILPWLSTFRWCIQSPRFVFTMW